jgi:hypothetical protein
MQVSRILRKALTRLHERANRETPAPPVLTAA